MPNEQKQVRATFTNDKETKNCFRYVSQDDRFAGTIYLPKVEGQTPPANVRVTVTAVD